MISKEESTRLKGIAILLMLFLHLFNTDERIGLCEPLLWVGDGKPLVQLLTRIARLCVPIYIFLSGYGLSYIYEKAEGKGMRTANRILRLYANYWIILLLFIPLGAWVSPEKYPEDLTTFILNFTAISYNYNYEWWFLMPYFILVLFSPYIIHGAHSLNKRQLLYWSTGILIIYIASHHLRGMVSVFPGKDFVFGLLMLFFPFFAGIIFSHHRILGRFRTYITRRWKGRSNCYLWLSVLAVCTLRVVIKASAFDALYALLLITLLTGIDIPTWSKHTLETFGHHSTNMWLTHTFYSWYFFPEFFYGLRYPLVMFIALVAVSYATSLVIQRLYDPLRKRIISLPF